MKWFIVALMATIQPDMSRDVFVFYKPTFDTVKECVAHVQKYPKPLMWKLAQEFPNDKLDKILCVPEESVKEIIQQSIPKDKNLLDT